MLKTLINVKTIAIFISENKNKQNFYVTATDHLD
jgi:hypothetical protein